MQNYTLISSGTLKPVTRESDDEYDYTEPRTDVYMIDLVDADTIDDETSFDIRERYRSRCSCAHDCCGHRNGGVSSIVRMYAGRYLVTVSTALNV